MSRKEMIEILIEDRICEWVYARCDDELREAIEFGLLGLDRLTDSELKDQIEDLGEDTVRELKEMIITEGEEGKDQNCHIALGSNPFE